MSTHRRLLTLVAALSLGGCYATRFDNKPCKDPGQCRKAFGFGATCNKEGLCEPAQAHKRCDSSFPEDLFSHPERYRDAIVIGSLMDRSSGPHQVREKAVKLAVKEAAAMGGVERHPVAAVLCNIAQDKGIDELTRTQAAVESARFLASTLGVAAIVGPSASGDAQQVWDAVGSKGTVIISPAATSPALLKLEETSSDAMPGYLWRVAPPDSLQGVVIADDMLARDVKEVAIIRQSDAYGDGLTKVFQERFTKAGGSVMLYSIDTDTQIAEAVTMAGAGNASEVLFISSQQDWATKFLLAARTHAGFQTKRIFLTDAAANETVLANASTASALFERVRGTRPAPRGSQDHVFTTFVASYSLQYPGEDPTKSTFSNHAYDSAWLALYGAAWSLLREGGVTGLGIAKGLRRVSDTNLESTPITPSSWLGVIAAFRAGKSVNVSGASGELDFHPVTRSVVAPIQIWKIDSTAAPPAIAQVAIKTPE